MRGKRPREIKVVFVSGCFDIIHGGHVQFLKDAASLGQKLIVSIAGDKSLLMEKSRCPAMPTEDRASVLLSFNFVDEVIVSDGEKMGFNFLEDFLKIRPDILAVTEDDKYGEDKKKLCEEIGCHYGVLPKTKLTGNSTTSIRGRISAPAFLPLRVDFAGGWLDVPRFSMKEGFIVNCTISPTVSLHQWTYNQGGGLGGSAAWSILNGKQPIKSELDLGVGWQDPSVILETGLCVWASGIKPKLLMKRDPHWLNGLIGIFWTGVDHNTPSVSGLDRDYPMICSASKIAKEAVEILDYQKLCQAVQLSYQVQLKEGMVSLQDKGELAKKYLGGGFGGYAMYLFESSSKRKEAVDKHGVEIVEPYIKEYE